MVVPHVAESPRRVDKTAVLRYSAHGLRSIYGERIEWPSIWKPRNLIPFLVRKTVFGRSCDKIRTSIDPETVEAFAHMVNGFLLTVTCRGIIVSVSSTIEQHLGHCQVIFRTVLRLLLATSRPSISR